MKRVIICLLMLTTLLFSADDGNSSANNGNSNGSGIELTPPIPLPPELTNPETKDDYTIPEIKKERVPNLEGNELRYLEHTYTVMMESKVDLYIPLEVITDIDIDATVIGKQVKEIPFEIELNRTPEKKDYYSIKYSESVIDIDNDGKPDTYIHSPKYVNERIVKDNYVKIYGENISKAGKHTKDVYITVEVGDTAETTEKKDK